VRGTLFDPAFSGLSGRYPTGQEIIPFEACVIQVGSTTP
jgi:hypothetical protein